MIVPSHRSAALYAKPVLISVLSTHTRLLHYVAYTRAASNAVFLVERISTRDAKVVFLSLLNQLFRVLFDRHLKRSRPFIISQIKAILQAICL